MKKTLLLLPALIMAAASSPFHAAAQKQSHDNLLSVVVMVTGDTIQLQGYCLYLKDGKELRKDLTTDTAWGWNFRGDTIKKVEIRKVGGDASYRVFIMEGRDTASAREVFSSDTISSTDPVVYEKDPLPTDLR